MQRIDISKTKGNYHYYYHCISLTIVWNNLDTFFYTARKLIAGVWIFEAFNSDSLSPDYKTKIFFLTEKS